MKKIWIWLGWAHREETIIRICCSKNLISIKKKMMEKCKFVYENDLANVFKYMHTIVYFFNIFKIIL